MIERLVPYLVWIRVGAAVAALVAAFWAGSAWTGRGYETQIAAERAERAAAIAEQERLARAEELRRQEAADRLAEETSRKINELEKRAARADAAGRRLRDELAAANRGGAPAPESTAPVDDPFVLRELLVDLDGLAGVFARGAERCAVQLRGLQEFVGSLAPERAGP